MEPKNNKSLLGIAFMLAAVLLFPFLDAIAKHLGNQAIPVIEIVWARQFIGMLFLAPLLVMREGVQALRPRDRAVNFTRSILILAATAMFFGSLRYQGIAETLAIYFVQPLVLTALAPFVLGEHVGIRRWIAVVVGFAGVLIIIRPGFQVLNFGVLLAFGSGVCSGLSLLLTRKVAGSSSALATTFYNCLYGAILVSIAVTFVWKMPDQNQMMLFVLLALIGTTGNYLTVLACEYAEVSLLAPFGYAEMINAVILGWYIFGDFPDFWTFVGVGILVVCAIYISNRERLNHIKSEIVDPGRL